MSEIKNYEVIPNGFWGKPEVRQGLTREYIQEAVEYVFREEPQERQFTMYTGLEGRRTFDTALQDLVSEDNREANEELWTSVRTATESYSIEFLDLSSEPPTVTSLNAPLETPNVQRIRQGTTDIQEVHTQRLQNGDITLVEYLDLISEQ